MYICRIFGLHSGGITSYFFWDIKQCSPLKVNRRFGGTCHLHLQGRSMKQVATYYLVARSSVSSGYSSCPVGKGVMLRTVRGDNTALTTRNMKRKGIRLKKITPSVAVIGNNLSDINVQELFFLPVTPHFRSRLITFTQRTLKCKPQIIHFNRFS
jgi:hypothetical protein